MSSFKKACSSLALISILSAAAVSAFAGNQSVFPYNNPVLMETLSKYQINPTEVREVSLGEPTILSQNELDKIMQQEQIFFTSSKNLKNIGCVGAYVSTEYGNTWVIVNKCSKPISFNVVLRHNDGYTASFGKKCTPAHALYTTGYKYSWQLVSMTDGEPQC